MVLALGSGDEPRGCRPSVLSLQSGFTTLPSIDAEWGEVAFCSTLGCFWHGCTARFGIHDSDTRRWHSVLMTLKPMRGVRSRVESLYFMQRSVRAARSPRCANPRCASPGMCTDSERGGGRPGVPALSWGLDGLGEGARLWLPVPAFAFTTLTDCNQVRFRVSISVGLLTVLISCLEKLWGTPAGFRRMDVGLGSGFIGFGNFRIAG